jgi:DNA-directed RNA polymerase II subunit RPB1
MNMHVPQGIYAMAEALTLMQFGRCLVSDQGNKPLTGLIQDALLAVYLMTSTVELQVVEKDDKGVVISERKVVADVEENMNKQLWSDCIVTSGRYGTNAKGEDKIASLIRRCNQLGVNPYSGRGLLSFMLPEGYGYTKKDKSNIVSIVNGILITGSLNSSIIGSAGGSIHHDLHLRYGPKVATDFLSDVQRVANRWMSSYGYSIGYKDYHLCPEAIKDINQSKEALKQGVIDLGVKASNPFERKRVEADQLRASDNILSQMTAVVMKHIARDNRVLIMLKAGSKGNEATKGSSLG